MENNIYRFEMPHYCLWMDNFKMKHADILRNTIASIRLGSYIKFSSYGNISFEPADRCHKFAKVSLLETFNRNKTNCLIYDIIGENLGFPKYYDKLVIFYTEGHSGSYGYLFINEETNSVLLQHTIDFELSKLCIRIWETFDSFSRRESLYKLWYKKV